MSIAEGIIQEIGYESVSTRTMLERCPIEQFGWKPHDKSMTLVRLASHIAETPSWVRSIVEQREMLFDPADYKPTEFHSPKEMVEAFDKNVADARAVLSGQPDPVLFEEWTFRMPEKVIFALPRLAVLRSMVLSHLVHHRGQLSVYLRLLNVPLPSVYGPTADEAGDS